MQVCFTASVFYQRFSYAHGKDRCTNLDLHESNFLILINQSEETWETKAVIFIAYVINVSFVIYQHTVWEQTWLLLTVFSSAHCWAVQLANVQFCSTLAFLTVSFKATTCSYFQIKEKQIIAGLQQRAEKLLKPYFLLKNKLFFPL